MALDETQARHVFHARITGWDRIHAWQAATSEPVFIWGGGPPGVDGPTFGPVKQSFRRWLATHPDCRITVYHDGIGADALGPMDPALHKVTFLHHWYPNWERHFAWFLRCTGKAMVGHPDLIGILRESFEWIPERFIQAVPSPLLSGLAEDRRPPESLPPRMGIWLHGKRWRRDGNRLRSLVDRWPQEAGQLEIITAGKGRPRWSRQDFVVWNTDLPMECALHRIPTWDSLLLLNDFTLDAPWLLRALQLGCFPLIPEGESPAHAAEWDSLSAPQPYAWGDPQAALDLLNQWRSAGPEVREAFADWKARLFKGHPEGREFRENWRAVKDQVAEQRAPRLRRRRAVSSFYPVAWYERLFRLRAGY